MDLDFIVLQYFRMSSKSFDPDILGHTGSFLTSVGDNMLQYILSKVGYTGFQKWIHIIAK